MRNDFHGLARPTRYRAVRSTTERGAPGASVHRSSPMAQLLGPRQCELLADWVGMNAEDWHIRYA